MTYEEAKELLKENGLSLTAFSKAADKAPATLWKMANKNNGNIPELYHLAILGFIQKAKANEHHDHAKSQKASASES